MIHIIATEADKISTDIITFGLLCPCLSVAAKSVVATTYPGLVQSIVKLVSKQDLVEDLDLRLKVTILGQNTQT